MLSGPKGGRMERKEIVERLKSLKHKVEYVNRTSAEEEIIMQSYKDMEALQKTIELLEKSAEQTANWVPIDDEPPQDWECSHCGRIVYGVEEDRIYSEHEYCHGCGSRMKGNES